MATIAPLQFDTIAEKVYANERITADDALFLFGYHDLNALAALANYRREQRTDPNVVSYIIGRILNYTNVCWVRCKFCAFYRVPGHDVV